jgi:delta 1-pyrroline-5-carboxylate dehydrogenase
MKYDIELLVRARDYCDMTIDDIMTQDAGHYETEAKRSLNKAITEINNAIDLLVFYNAEQ